ncbi:M50 family metallopeptidase [Thalassotalea sp. LPB0316]|uniref:M50 family metallopeptidase n=1 Tax=Thalassotalea sp. LPB0316 TaxID=2769490 RepID=UPI001868FF95|nr:M50 family metallopeptidase [Thalassotalea sp. LPB0316]QOL24635.1 M50 family metallopeptidase [Thalassotalea sp. LPB0316]
MSEARQSLFSKYQFYWLLLAAVILRQIPIVSVPFNWLESYFHELSHGLAAILTGGRIVQIELFTNGAGLCTTQGGIRFVVSFMGYLGATLFGMLIYQVSGQTLVKAKVVCGGLISLLVITLFLWTRDLLTAVILLILIGLFLAKWQIKHTYSLNILLKFTGIIVLLNSVYSPLYLIDGRHMGDGATLASLTFIPELIWVALWTSLGLLALFYLAKKAT